MTPLSNFSNGPQLTPKNNRYIVSLKDRVEEAHDLDFLKEDGFRHLETFDFRPD